MSRAQEANSSVYSPLFKRELKEHVENIRSTTPIPAAVAVTEAKIANVRLLYTYKYETTHVIKKITVKDENIWYIFTCFPHCRFQWNVL